MLYEHKGLLGRDFSLPALWLATWCCGLCVAAPRLRACCTLWLLGLASTAINPRGRLQVRIDFVCPGSHPPRPLSGGDAAAGVRCFLDDASSMMVRATCALIELVTGVASDSVDSVIIVYDQTLGGLTDFTGHVVDALLVGLHRGFRDHRVRPDFR